VIGAASIAAELMAEIRGFAASIGFPSLDRELSPDEKLAESVKTAPLPTQAQIASIIDPLFWASIETEEQRPTRFRVAYKPTEVEMQLAMHRLREPVPLDIGNLRRFVKLAHAHDRLASFLALDFLPDPAIVGIGVFHSRGAVPHAFHVVSKAQASLEFLWSSFQLGTLRGGELSLLSRAGLRADAAADWVTTCFGSTGLRLLIGSAARIIAEQGHGGSIWAVAPGGRLSEGLRVGYPVEVQPEFLREMPKYEHRQPWGFSIGNLAGVDGAIVVDGDGQVLGFGAFIDLPKEPIAVIEYGPDGVGRAMLSDQLGGGRHRSAIAFCASHAPSSALVVSDDGGISAARRLADDAPVEFARVNPNGFGDFRLTR
jgi:sensor domain DACNV-containing protein